MSNFFVTSFTLSIFQYFEFGRWMYFEICVKIVQRCSQQKLPFFVLFFKNFSSTLAVIPYAEFMFSDPSWKKLTTTFLNQKWALQPLPPLFSKKGQKGQKNCSNRGKKNWQWEEKWFLLPLMYVFQKISLVLSWASGGAKRRREANSKIFTEQGRN